MRVIYHPEAESETIETAKFCESRRTGLSGEFLDEVDDATEKLMDDPKRFPLTDDDIRRQFVRRFRTNRTSGCPTTRSASLR